MILRENNPVGENGDATQEAQADPAVAAFLQALSVAAQMFIDAKGL